MMPTFYQTHLRSQHSIEEYIYIKILLSLKALSPIKSLPDRKVGNLYGK